MADELKSRRGKLFKHLMKYPHHDLKIETVPIGYGPNRPGRIIDLWVEGDEGSNVVEQFSRPRDAKRALLRLGYVREGNAWRSTPKRVQLPLWEPPAVAEARAQTPTDLAEEGLEALASSVIQRRGSRSSQRQD